MHRTATSELDPISEIPMGVNARDWSRALGVALELGNIAERIEYLRERFGSEQIWLTQVMYCGMVEEAQKN